MKIVELNGGVFGSTGKIMFGIAELLEKEGHSVLCAAPVTPSNRSRQPSHPYWKIGSYQSRRFCVLFDRITGCEGSTAYLSTRKLLKQIDAFAPDLIHIHVVHGNYLHLPTLFSYLKRSGAKVVWTFHDCWAFTGHCPHFVMAHCDKWKTQCHTCPSYRLYPKALRDNSKKMYRRKQKWFCGVPDMTIVTPSQWLADLTRQSFLREYPVQVIHNGIDLSVFHPSDSDFREKYGIGQKFILLGVAFGWGERKGLDVFSELQKRIDTEQYQIVLVGTDPAVCATLPQGIIAIDRTHDQAELAQIYTAADLLVNPTREDNFPTVNIEALACGTPVLTFRTGGSPEIPDESCGAVVDVNDTDAMFSQILRITKEHPFSEQACLQRAKEFSAADRFAAYVRLFEQMTMQE